MTLYWVILLWLAVQLPLAFVAGSFVKFGMSGE